MFEMIYNGMNIFIDSDVVISSILSPSGASNFLLQDIGGINKFISNYSFDELSIVIDRLSLDKAKLQNLIKGKMNLVNIEEDLDSITLNYRRYTLDINDSHIILGSVKSKSRFLITYNIKHYKIEEIKREFNILVVTPGIFLQYLRSKPTLN